MTTPTLPTPEQWRHWGIDPGWSRTVEAGGHTWHVLERAPASPIATIVCVHGNPTWSILWRSMLERLGDRYRVIAIDQLGMGWSARTGSRTYADRIADLDEVIRALGVDGPLVLVGHDWGGAIAMGWAVGHADRITGLVLCNTGIAVPAGRRAPWLIRLAAAEPIRRLVCERTRVFVNGTGLLSRRRLDRAARAGLRAPYRHRSSRRAVADFVGDVPLDDSHPSAAVIATVADRLAEVRAPVLLVWGAADPVFDDTFSLDLARRMPHAAQHRFADIGHLSPLEADVASVVDPWLGDLFGGRRSTTPPTAADTYTPTWQALVDHANDDTIAYVDMQGGAAVSFRELHNGVMSIAAGLTAAGLRPGDRVAMLVPPSADLVAAVYAVWRAGGITVVADRGLGLSGLGRAVRAARPDWVIGPPPALAVASLARWAPGARRIAVSSRSVPGAVATLEQLARTPGPPPPEPSPDSPAAVLHTSGATGPAKGVRYTHRQLAAQRDALAATYRITTSDRLVAAFAPFALYGPALGIPSTIPDVDVTTPGALTAAALADACRAIDATIVFASPAALTNVLATSGDRPLPVVRLGLSAGAPVPAETLRAMATLTPGAEWHTPYGMTECLPVADIDLAEIENATGRRGVCVGHPVVGAAVAVAPLGFDAAVPITWMERGGTGEVMVRAPWLSTGYDRRWGIERDARPIDSDEVVWHRTGDVGHLDEIGRLWIEGRAVHVVHTDCGPLTPVPVERAVEQLDEVARSAAVGIGPPGCQQLVVVIEPSSRSDARIATTEGVADIGLTTKVRAVVADAVGHPVAAVIVVSTLPVDIRHNTKIDRTLIASWASEILSGERTRRPW